MSELIDKLERAAKGASQPLGFGGAAKRERIAPILILGGVDAGDAAQAKTVVEAELDAVIVSAREGAKKADVDKSAKALKGVTCGVWFDEGQASDTDGADFQIFSSAATPIGALAGEKRTTVMQVAPELDDSLLRTIDMLPVDAFFVSLADADSLTISQLMRLGRVRGVTSRWLIAYLPALPSKEEAEQLRDVGVAAIAVSAKDLTAEAFKATREMLLDLPRESAKKKQRERGSVTLPRQSSTSAASAPPPEPDDDDDDWDDE